MQYQRPPTSLFTHQFRGLRNGFLAGLIVGMLIGWFFHGFVGLVVRFGFVLVLLIPLALVAWFFFVRGRGGTTSPAEGEGGMRVYTWRSGEGESPFTADPRRSRRSEEPSQRAQTDDDIIDLEFRELKRKVDRDE